jgi:hypothetical protein
MQCRGSESRSYPIELNQTMADVWNPFDAPVAETPDGGWPSDDEDASGGAVTPDSLPRERLDSMM